MFRYMTMSEPLPQPAWRQMELPLTLSAAGSRVSPTASPDSATATPTSATSGPSSPASFARLGPGGSWLRMCLGYCQATLDGSLEEYSETWPKQGTMRNGSAYPLPTWGRRTSASASGSSLTHKPTHHVPTPTASDYIERTCTSVQSPLNYETNKSVTLDRWVRMWPTPQAHDAALGNPARVGRYGTKHGGRNLNDEVALWPTPRSQTGTPTGRDWKDGDAQSCRNVPANGLLGRVVHQWQTPRASDGEKMSTLSIRRREAGCPPDSLPDQIRAQEGTGSLNPAWVCWLMGLPLDWVDV